MATKLFPNLERVTIKEHAKSKNYEEYMGVVLDKKNNIFKVVDGTFADKKDMYEKMKARGLILRKAYERKVWEWIEANADGVIIAYLMLSTAFSKWRSNNVLHDYYQKLLTDIPELNRERDKGNPNTRGGDFITTDDKESPKRKTESVELKEGKKNYNDDEKHLVQLYGVTKSEEDKEPLNTGNVTLPNDIIKKDSVSLKNLFNISLLNLIESYLTGENKKGIKRDKVKLIITLEDGKQAVRFYNTQFIKDDKQKCINATTIVVGTNPDTGEKYTRYDILKNDEKVGLKKFQFSLIGIIEEKELINLSNEEQVDEKSAGKEMKVLYNNKGKLKDPVIAEIVNEYLNTDNIKNRTGEDTQNKYLSIEVHIDGELKKSYKKSSVLNDLKEIADGVVEYSIDPDKSINLQIDPYIGRYRKAIEQGNTKLEDSEALKLLTLQKLYSSNNASLDASKISGWQAKAVNQLGGDSGENRRKMTENIELNHFLSDLTSDKGDTIGIVRQDGDVVDVNGKHIGKVEGNSTKAYDDRGEFIGYVDKNGHVIETLLQQMNSYVKNNIANHELNNTFYTSIPSNQFIPFNIGEIKEVARNLQIGKPLSNDENERKKLLKNVIWYVLASSKQEKESNKGWSKKAYQNNLLDSIDNAASLIEKTMGSQQGGVNPKTGGGDRNYEQRVGNLSQIRDNLSKLISKAERSGLQIPKFYKDLTQTDSDKRHEPTPDEVEKAGEVSKQMSNEREQSRSYNAKATEPSKDTTPEPLKKINEKIANKYNLSFRMTSSSDDRISFYDVKNLAYRNIGDKKQLEPGKRTEYFLNHLDEYEAELEHAIDEIKKERPKKDEVKVVMSPEERLEKAIKDYKEYKDLQNISFEDYVKANKDRNKPVDYDEYSKKIGNFTYDDLYKAKKVSSFNDFLDYNIKGVNAITEIKKLRNEFLKKYPNEDAFFDILKKNNLSLSDLEESQVNDGATLMHRYSPYQGAGFNYSAGPIKMTGQIVEDITKTELNPKFFENDVLIPEVRDALYKIAIAFKDYLDLPFEVKDIYFTGSNANYNYTDESDIDLHLVYDFEQAGVNAELLSKYLVAAKKDFNNKYDIKVKGQPVELGCENISEPLVSTGVYSLGANTWVIKPTNSGIEIPDVDMNAFNDLSMEIDDTIKAQNYSAIENLWKKIRELRKDSLSNEGEFGMGNMLFKKLRNAEYLEKLRNTMYDVQSKDLSLESSKAFGEAELNDKKDYSEYLKDLKDELDTKETKDLLTSKSLLKYLDGYRDRSDRQVIPVKDGVLEEEVGSRALSKAIRYAENDIPPDISDYEYFDLDGSICAIDCVIKRNRGTQEDDVRIYKSPVKREKTANGSFVFMRQEDAKEEISIEEMNEILENNRHRLEDTTHLYDNLDEVLEKLYAERDNRKTDFDKWVEENNDYLHLDEIYPNEEDKFERNMALHQLYNLNKHGVSTLVLRNEVIPEQYGIQMPKPEMKVEEDTDREKLKAAYNQFKLNNSKKKVSYLHVGRSDELNKINKVLRALGISPDYLTRYIYEHVKEYDKTQRKNIEHENIWKIVGVEDVSEYLAPEYLKKDGTFDEDKLPINPNFVKITMRDVSRTGNMDMNKAKEFTVLNVKNIIEAFPEENDIDSEDDKVSADVLKYSSSNLDRVRSNPQSNFYWKLLTDDQVKQVLSYAQSDNFTSKIKEELVALKNEMKMLNVELPEDKKELYKKKIQYRKKNEDLMYLVSKDLIDVYDNLTHSDKNGIFLIMRALRSVNDNAKLKTGKLDTARGVGFYIKLPKEDNTAMGVKHQGTMTKTSVLDRLHKNSGGF